ncbi:hypothetical protein [Actinomadura chibensis]|uniref:Uncharacterized protein n=1 Tax=Actinomadura chibensis TaxID=392828 RepID=A0A5D0N6T2_9ACTN|nr:hypothetical protein [Actinomadura chibensis]TYB40059.1 hypothetical protein FXF69_39355 [Actinomadura chibensis]
MPVQIVRDQYGAHQFAGHLGITRWQLRVGLEHGILPRPDLDGERWSAALADECRGRGRGEQVIAAFGEIPPIGSTKAAIWLAERVGLDVERRDVEVLAAQGELNVISTFRGHPVYLLKDLDRLDPASVRSVVAARKGPLMETVDAGGAATILGWPRRTFDRIAGERDLPIDRLGRYALADVQALAADDELMRGADEEKRRLALTRTRRSEIRVEDVVRGWILRCSAYLDGDAEEPPDTGSLNRALRNLTNIRTELARHDRRAP